MMMNVWEKDCSFDPVKVLNFKVSNVETDGCV